METTNETNLTISEFQAQDQVFELDDNEVDNITGGLAGFAFGLGYSLGGGLSFQEGLKVTGAATGIGNVFGPAGASLSTPKA